jgi:hypothetical protein
MVSILSQRAMKNLQSMTRKKKEKKSLKLVNDDVAC